MHQTEYAHRPGELGSEERTQRIGDVAAPLTCAEPVKEAMKLEYAHPSVLAVRITVGYLGLVRRVRKRRW